MRFPRQDDLAQRLFEARTVVLNGDLTPSTAAQLSAQLLGMASASSDPITVSLNVPGGDLEAGLSLHDVVRFLAPRVRMIGTGRVAGPGLLVYVAAERADRYSLPHARYGLVCPEGTAPAGSRDIERAAEEMVRLRTRVAELLTERTGQSGDRVRADLKAQTWLGAEEAVAYGLAGQTVQSIREVR